MVASLLLAILVVTPISAHKTIFMIGNKPVGKFARSSSIAATIDTLATAWHGGGSDFLSGLFVPMPPTSAMER